MRFHLSNFQHHTTIPPELLEIYQPILGYEAIAIWINIYHALINNHTVSEGDLLQQMNITQRTFRDSLEELKKYKLIEDAEQSLIVAPPRSAKDFIALIGTGDYPSEIKRRVTTLLDSFHVKRGQTTYPEPEAEPVESSAELHQMNEQLADEFATRFIKECKFIPNKQLRERFDFWFDQITDSRLLDELLDRTKRKLQMEGSKSTCPSLYTDKIVRQWLVQGIKTYADLMQHDKEFHARWEYYRIVEKELGRGFNSLTPAEKEIIDNWISTVTDVNELSRNLKKAILSGDYQGKGAPGIAFIDKWLNRREGKAKPKGKVAPFTHQHTDSDLQLAIRRKTVNLEDVKDER